jgi:hypothetical protein
MNMFEQQTTLNEALSLVYDLNDASEGVSNDLETLISQLTQKIEDMIDSNDKLLGDLK